MALSVEQVLEHAASTLNLLGRLGFTVNYLKSVLVPSQQMEFLGSLVNSLDLSLSLPRDKIRKIQSKSQDLLNTPVTTVRELSKFLGPLSSSIQAVFPAPLRYRYLQQAKNSVLRFRKSYEAVVHLDSECLQEVQCNSSTIYFIFGFIFHFFHKTFVLQARRVACSYCPRQGLRSSSP